MIEGKMIRLRSWKEKDVPTMTEIRNDVPLQAQLLARVRGSDEAQVRRWLQERSSSADSLLFIVADLASDNAIGFMQLTGMDPIDRRAELGICLIRSRQGKGVGSEVLLLALPHLRDSTGLRKLSLRVRADNDAAIRCYARVGFKQCGRLREHVHIEGSWHDLVLMDLFLRHES
jgi:diamine N-acetyltransferase